MVTNCQSGINVFTKATCTTKKRLLTSLQTVEDMYKVLGTIDNAPIKFECNIADACGMPKAQSLFLNTFLNENFGRQIEQQTVRKKTKYKVSFETFRECCLIRIYNLPTSAELVFKKLNLEVILKHTLLYNAI